MILRGSWYGLHTLFFVIETEAIALGDSLAPVSWYLRVNLGTKDYYCTSVLVC